MRIWDIDAGFLNDQSLLGEHRELHGIYSIISNNKKGYSRHPETLRWVSHLPALEARHGLLVEEMMLRGFKHHSPLTNDPTNLNWPSIFIDEPSEQYRLLKGKYKVKKQGRIPLPLNTQTLWASHKYSVMARDPSAAKKLGNQIANDEISFEKLSETLVRFLRIPPQSGRLANAVSHMWGYISDHSKVDPQKISDREQLLIIQEVSMQFDVDYLLHSTALSELKFWGEFQYS
jgi:hypothetical protein